tara:strand:+ start:395 stop:637 length:243 start_codon:yes stop_codon:yes gene_type:complete
MNNYFLCFNHTIMESSRKPIDAVNETLRSTNNILNEVKIDIICIKSDLMFIKDRLKEIRESEDVRKEKEAQISKGWLFSN